MNPYASYLNGRDPIEVMRSTPDELKRLLADLSISQMDEPTAPGKWSLREILAHLADCEVVWASRMRHALETPGVTVIPFDQDMWASRYRAYTADAALQTFRALRAWNLALLTTVTDVEKSGLLTHRNVGHFRSRSYWNPSPGTTAITLFAWRNCSGEQGLGISE